MPGVRNAVEELRRLLLAKKPAALEELSCQLLGRLVGVAFSRAGGGSQRGGDGGVRGDGRHLIYEAKRYDASTNFDNRSIRGEIDEAVERDPALEAWILVSTRDVPEQTLTAMEAAGRPRGVETLAIGWMPEPLPRLAALCAWAPDDVAALLGHECREILAEIRSAPDYDKVLDSLAASVRDSAVGFELLRRVSHVRVREVWQKRRVAETCFGQNVAGGAAGTVHVERAGAMAGLDAWDLGAVGSPIEPAVVVGREGTGKTWAVVDWLRSRLDRLPIVVLAPATALGTPIRGKSALVAFIARCLRDLDHTSERGEEFWEARVTRLLRRSVEEGAVLMLFFDGLNEEPSYPWRELMNQLQDEPFYGRVRVVASARKSFVGERLGDLQEWVSKPTRVEVGPYDDTPGGEFDKRLDAAALTRNELPRTLFELARVPRLFDLVIGLKDRLGGVEAVTVHRLFWEYGATAIPTNASSPTEWRAFILRLAEDFVRGQYRQDLAHVEELGAGAATPPDAVYRRVSSMIESVFGRLNRWGEVEFEADFVRHALGLALVRKLDGQSGLESREALERFFEPLNEHDEEAEVLRAAVSIALAQGVEGDGGFLEALCSRWVRCQNLPESHLRELAGLAAELVEPLLGVVEAASGHAASSARYRAVNALGQVDYGDAEVARAIASRGTTWLRRISQERGADGAGADSQRVQWRRERLEARIGTAHAGLVTVLGEEVEIVPQTDQGLAVAAAQLLQGRPLVDAIGFLEAGALHLGICGEGGEEEPWLNMVNDVDPVETAARLRERSEAMLLRQPEDGVHESLNERVAALLLWRTGYEGDVERALQVDPGLDRPSYAEEYEAHPAKSLYRLERRHVQSTLLRKDVALRARIDRASTFLVDPSLEVPTSFVEEVVRAADKLDWNNIALGRSQTAEDWMWRDLSWVLARCAPVDLVRVERARLRGFAGREGEARFGAAMAAPNAMLLVGEVERAALRELRKRSPEEPADTEAWTQTQLLIAEVQGEDPIDQARRIAEAGLDAVDGSLAQACGSPTMADLEDLVDQHRADPWALRRVAEIIGQKPVSLGERAFEAFVELLFGALDGAKLEPVWVVLGLNAAERLGAELDERGWAWSAEKSHMENLMGSMAVAAANRETPFASFAARLAPVRLLPVVCDRGASQEDVRLAVELVSKVLMRQTPVPETPLEVSHDMDRAQETVAYLYSYGDIQEEDDPSDVRRVFSRLEEDYPKRRQELAERYFEDVMEARRRGACFHLELVLPDHLGVVFDCCPDVMNEWLDGMIERSPAFTERARLADGLFVPLCEALLVREPKLGVELWRALKDCLNHATFTIHGDMDRLLDALLAAGPSEDVGRARAEVYGLAGARSDRELVALVLAARRHGRLDWMRRMVAMDAASECPLQQRRAAFLEPMLTSPQIAGDGGWPQGEFAGGVRGASWKLGQREAFSRHWLRAFVEADSEVAAHTFWQIFLACVDRRAWSWMEEEMDRHAVSESGLGARKKRFVAHQKNEIRRAIAKNEKNWAENYTHNRYPKALWPWSQ